MGRTERASGRVADAGIRARLRLYSPKVSITSRKLSLEEKMDIAEAPVPDSLRPMVQNVPVERVCTGLRDHLTMAPSHCT